MMRGKVDRQGEVFHAFLLDDLVPAGHPLRAIKARADRVLGKMSRRFNQAYADKGRPGVPPERLIKALLLQSLYSIRSEIQLCEQIGYNMLYRWFLDMNPSEKTWTPEVFSMNRRRFADHGLVSEFFDCIVREAILEGLVSGDHFSVDGTLIQSFASMKSLRPIHTNDNKVSDGADDDDPGNPTVNFRKEKRSNETHRSLVDPEARLARKSDGKPAMLSHSGHILMENRNGLCMAIDVDEANGVAERIQSSFLIDHVYQRHGLFPKTLGTDAGYRDGKYLHALEQCGIKPHVPMGTGSIKGKQPADDARRRAQRRQSTVGYQLSQRIRKRVEEVFGWCKSVGGMARSRFVGRWKLKQQCQATAAAYNLLRLARLAPCYE